MRFLGIGSSTAERRRTLVFALEIGGDSGTTGFTDGFDLGVEALFVEAFGAALPLPFIFFAVLILGNTLGIVYFSEVESDMVIMLLGSLSLEMVMWDGPASSEILMGPLRESEMGITSCPGREGALILARFSFELFVFALFLERGWLDGGAVDWDKLGDGCGWEEEGCEEEATEPWLLRGKKSSILRPCSAAIPADLDILAIVCCIKHSSRDKEQEAFGNADDVCDDGEVEFSDHGGCAK